MAIVLAGVNVVQEIESALALTPVDLIEHVERLPPQVNEIPADLKDLVDQRLEFAIRFWLARAPCGQRCRRVSCLSQRYELRVTRPESVPTIATRTSAAARM